MIAHLKRSSDSIGTISSLLCMVHCVATPFVFVAMTCEDSCCQSSPLEWQLIDVGFLLISLSAIIPALKNAHFIWVKVGLIGSWKFLGLIIINNYWEVLSLSEQWIYVPAILLIILHLYNRKNCNRVTDCCG